MRHVRNGHIETRLVKAKVEKEILEVDDLQGRIDRSLNNVNFTETLCRAHMEGDTKLRKKATKAIAELGIRAAQGAIKYYELEAKIAGQIPSDRTEDKLKVLENINVYLTGEGPE